MAENSASFTFLLKFSPSPVRLWGAGVLYTRRTAALSSKRHTSLVKYQQKPSGTEYILAKQKLQNVAKCKSGTHILLNIKG